MNKIVIIGIIFLFVLMSFTTISGNQLNNQIVKTSDRSNILYVGGSGEGNYTTIQSAINHANDGDTVFVFDDSSPYIETLWINKSIDLIGENKDSTVIDGNNSGSCVNVNADWINISGFTIQHCGYGFDDAGIIISSNYIIITGNKISSNNVNGLRLHWSIGSIIKDNKISSNNEAGIYLHKSRNSIITGNNITSNDVGLSLHESRNNIITGNNITNNDYSGIQTYRSDNIITGNNLSNNGRGIYLTSSSDNIITGNNLSNNKNGIFLRDSSSSIITGNNITNNKNGIYLTDSSNDNIISSNKLSNNEKGIYLVYTSDNNIFYHNNFINNTQNAHDECINSWDNGYPSGGNFWDDYNGTDIDGDGIGDIPYSIPGGYNKDRYPLIEPWNGNRPPYAPAIDGPTGVPPGTYEYKFKAIDPDGDNISYTIDWGDANSDETVFYKSGEVVTVSHTYSSRSCYIITAYAKDEHGLVGPEGTNSVEISRDKSTNNMLFWRLIGQFPKLERLLFYFRA